MTVFTLTFSKHSLIIGKMLILLIESERFLLIYLKIARRRLNGTLDADSTGYFSSYYEMSDRSANFGLSGLRIAERCIIIGFY